MLDLKDALILKWAFNSPGVRYHSTTKDDLDTHTRFGRGVSNIHALVEYLVLGGISFIFMVGCAWTIFITNANVFVLIICIPLGGLATIFWLTYGFLLISEILFGSS